MRTILLTFIVGFFCSTCYGAQLLVQAKDSPFEKGAKKGDVIVVRPDGWVWGKEECMPRYIVVKMPGVKVEDAKKYEESLTEQVEKVVEGKTEVTSEMVRLRKYNVGASVVDGAKFTANNVYEVPTKSISTFTAGIVEKDVAVEKVAIADAVALKEVELEAVK